MKIHFTALSTLCGNKTYKKTKIFIIIKEKKLKRKMFEQKKT